VPPGDNDFSVQVLAVFCKKGGKNIRSYQQPGVKTAVFFPIRPAGKMREHFLTFGLTVIYEETPASGVFFSYP
jgi:hypothetical protein